MNSKVIIILTTAFVCSSLAQVATAQAPNKMSYQSVVRNSSGAVVANGNVGIRISLLQGSATGTTAYAETHSLTTDANGIASLEIGGGAPVTSTLASINWANGPYFIKTETDPAGGSSYTISGTSQLLSVPYALYSTNGLPTGTTIGNTLYWNGTSWINSGNIFNNGANVGIGAPIPAAKLDILGNIKIKDGTEGAGKVLTSDATGVASWVTSTSGWSLTGNSGTVDGTNFIGTTDNKPINLIVNNQKAGRIDPAGPVFLGYQAGSSNNVTFGFQNTGIGYKSLYSNTFGTVNTAIGFSSLQFNATGEGNTSIGSEALYSNTSGNGNTAIGNQPLYSNTTGYSNTACGEQSLYSNTTGTFNTAIGSGSLNSNTTGGANTASGYFALHANTIGDQNTAIGLSALSSNTTGSNNAALGVSALRFNTIGSFNTAVGEIAFLNGTNFSNSTAVGYNAQITASNMIRLGDANVTSINGAVAFTVVSDARFKKGIQENVLGLPFIMKLRPVTYYIDMDRMAKFMKTPDSLRIKKSEEAKEKVLQTGFIAQEVEKAAKELSYDFSGIDKPDSEIDYYGLRYAEFTVPLVKAVQEQQKMIEDLQTEIKQLKEQAASKQTAMGKLEQENILLKSTFEGRLKKIEDMLSAKAQK